MRGDEGEELRVAIRASRYEVLSSIQRFSKRSENPTFFLSALGYSELFPSKRLGLANLDSFLHRPASIVPLALAGSTVASEGIPLSLNVAFSRRDRGCIQLAISYDVSEFIAIHLAEFERPGARERSHETIVTRLNWMPIERDTDFGTSSLHFFDLASSRATRSRVCWPDSYANAKKSGGRSWPARRGELAQRVSFLASSHRRIIVREQRRRCLEAGTRSSRKLRRIERVSAKAAAFRDDARTVRTTSVWSGRRGRMEGGE